MTKRKNNVKTELAEALKARLRYLGMKQEDFALNARLAHDTFRSQLARNTFSPHTLIAAANLLVGGNVDQLERTYTFAKTQQGKEIVLAPTDSIRKRVERVVRAKTTKLAEDIRRLYSWLGPEDLVVICTLNELPLECTVSGWNSVKTDLVEAVKNGAAFIYIRPSENVIDKMSKPLWEFFQGKSPRDQHKDLQSKLIAELKAENVSAEHIRSHVRLFEENEWCPFWAIGMRFGLYVTKDESGRRDITLLARFPFGGGLQSDQNVLLFGDQKMRDAFHAYLINRFEKIDDLRPLLDRLR